MQVISNYTDSELIHALNDNKEIDSAIRFIYKNYYHFLEAYVVGNKGSTDDAADIIQDTIVAFITVVQEDKFRGESSVKSFLYAIVRNIWLTELKKRSNANNRNFVFEKAKDTTEKEVVEQLIKHEYHKSIQLLFEKLGEKCKQLLMLVYYEDLSMKDIVDKMPDYQNEQVLRNKKYKCMKQLEIMVNDNEPLRTQFKNALKYAG